MNAATVQQETAPTVKPTQTKLYTQIDLGRDKFKLVTSEKGHHYCFFQYEGTVYRLQKRGLKWYPVFQINNSRPSMSLDTDDHRVAIERAIKRLIQPLKQERWGDVAALKRKTPSHTLAELFTAYQQIYMRDAASARNNCSSLLTLVRQARGQSTLTAEQILLTDLSPNLLWEYQRAKVTDYTTRSEQSNPGDDSALRQAKERALRSSFSTFRQARAVFKKQYLPRYAATGLTIPDCALQFARTSAEGHSARQVYRPVSETILRQTFAAVETLQDQRLVTLFWIAVGTAMRCKEIAFAKVSDFVESNGRLAVNGGIGKDGKPIYLPVLRNELFREFTTRNPEAILRQRIEEARASGQEYLLPGEKWVRRDTIPRLHNQWLTSLGWNDTKKTHALRAFTASLLYLKDPQLAKAFLRHKTLSTTEQFYSHFARLHKGMENI